MGKIAALDIGDVWTGIALSDPLKIVASPYQTYKTAELETTLQHVLDEEHIERIVVGNPRTLRGTESDQTRQVHKQFAELENAFPEIPFVLWDERLSSKRAEALSSKKANRQKDKQFSHARAAAFILDTYLQAHHSLT